MFCMFFGVRQGLRSLGALELFVRAARHPGLPGSQPASRPSLAGRWGGQASGLVLAQLDPSLAGLGWGPSKLGQPGLASPARPVGPGRHLC